MQIKEIILPFKKDYLLAIASMVAGGISGVFSAKHLGLLVQEGLVKRDSSLAWTHAWIVLVLLVTTICLNWFAKRKLIEAAGKSIELLRSTLFNFIQKIKISFYDTTALGKVVTRITHDVDSMEGFLSGSFAGYCVEGISIILAITAIIIQAPGYGSVLVACFIPVFLLIILTHKQIGKVFRNEAKYRSKANALLAEFIKGFFVIRLFGLEDWAYQKYLGVLEKLKKSRLTANLFYTWFFPTAAFLAVCPVLLHLGVGAFKVIAGTLPLYIFIAFFQYCGRISSALNIFVHELQQVYNIITCAGRVADFLKAPTEFSLPTDQGTLQPPILGHIQYQNVGMQYSNATWALKDVSFEIKAGEKVGLVGRTGSGKTSCINLLTRLYDFQEGQITIDGHPIKDIDPYYLRNCIGVVTQDVVLFKGTILENITLGECYTNEKIQSVLASIGLDLVLKNNNLTLNSMLYDQGSNLSTGQRQLLNIARIYLRAPKILIMDEATANIDPFYEHLIHQALDQLMEGKTCLFIAHRLETLSGCHRLLEFAGGKLVTHQEPLPVN